MDKKPLRIEESIREIVRAQSEAMRLPKALRPDLVERDKLTDSTLDALDEDDQQVRRYA